MKKTLTVLIVIVIAFVSIAVFKDFLIKSTITVVGSKVLGAPVNIRSFSLSIFSQKVRIKDLKVYNPAGFPKGILVDIPEIGVDYDLPTLMKGKLHLPLVIVNLKEMVVIKNKEGKLNVDSLKVAETKEKPKEKPTKPGEMMPFKIDDLKLNVGQVVYKDYTKGESPSVQTYDVNIKDREYKDITSVQHFAALILAESMKQTAIKSAKIYAAAAILGVGFLPVGVAQAFMGQDSSSQEFNASLDQAYEVSLKILEEMGTLTSGDKAQGSLKGNVQGADISIKLEKKENKVVVIVSARKYMLPKPEIAGGVLYQIAQKLR